MSNQYLESEEPTPEEILDSDASYQKMQDEIDRHFWVQQDKERSNDINRKYRKNPVA
jgi:hypothetical protein